METDLSVFGFLPVGRTVRRRIAEPAEGVDQGALKSLFFSIEPFDAIVFDAPRGKSEIQKIPLCRGLCNASIFQLNIRKQIGVIRMG